MTSFNRRSLEMLQRVLVFAANYPQYFVSESATDRLLEQIKLAVRQLADFMTAQSSGKGDARVSTADRATARVALKGQLETISKTARGLKLSQFWLSRDKSDRSLVESGHRFVSRAEPLQQLFVESHVAPDFLDKLKNAVQEFEKTIADQVFKENKRKAATQAVEQARSAALSALEQLDPLVENLLQNDRPALAVWQSARRIERYAARRVQADATPPNDAASAEQS